MSKAQETMRTDLAHKFEIVGRFLEMPGVEPILLKTKDEITVTQYNGITIELMSLGLKNDKRLMDDLVAMHAETDDEAVQAMTDAEYSKSLRDAMLQEVLGFFG